MEKKKDMKKVVIGALLLVAACVILWLVYQKVMPKGEKGAKMVTVKVVHQDGSEKAFNYHTDEAYLGAVLEAEGLVEGTKGTYGLFITKADGEVVDESKQQWWCLTKESEQVNTSADQTPAADGDTFELTFTEGY